MLRGPVTVLAEASKNLAQASGRLIQNPWQSLDWGMEVSAKFLRLVDGQIGGPMSPRRVFAAPPVS